jgi:hypothetical protein
MAFSSSGLFYLTLRDILQNDTAIDYLADTVKAALFTNSITTPDYATNTAYAAAPFNANEVGSPSGGIQLANDAISTTGTVLLKYDSDDVAWGSQTITNARGCLVYDDTITTPTADPALFAVTFGADFSVTSGVLTIVVDSAGWFTIDLVP